VLVHGVLRSVGRRPGHRCVLLPYAPVRGRIDSDRLAKSVGHWLHPTRPTAAPRWAALVSAAAAYAGDWVIANPGFDKHRLGDL
jgi:hypothetical protein